MNIFNSLTLIEMKNGMNYTFTLPASGQTYKDVAEVLESMKLQIMQIEKNNSKQKQPVAVKEVQKNESAAPTGESEPKE